MTIHYDDITLIKIIAEVQQGKKKTSDDELLMNALARSKPVILNGWATAPCHTLQLDAGFLLHLIQRQKVPFGCCI